MTANETKKVALTTVEDVKKALKTAKLDNKFRVIATELSINDNRVAIHLINKDKTLSNRACFQIGINRTNFRFSSNNKFSACEFLKNEKENTKHRYEVTIKRDDIVNVLIQACNDYTQRYASTTTVKKAEQTEKKAN